MRRDTSVHQRRGRCCTISFIVCMLFAGLVLFAPVLSAENVLWDLSKNALGACSGNVSIANGKVALRDGTAFAIPAEAFPDMKNFTVQITLSFNQLLAKSLFTMMTKQTTGDDGFDFSILNHQEIPGNATIYSSVNKILLESPVALGKNWPQIETPTTFNLVVRNGFATFYHGDRPIKSCSMEMTPNSEPMWIGRNTDLQFKPLPVTLHEVKVYGANYKFVSKIEENSPRKSLSGKGWTLEAPKTIEHSEWPKVMIYGDSVMLGYRPSLEAELSKRNVYIFSYCGFVNGEVPEQVLADAAASHKFDVIVFNNGLHSLSWTKKAVPDAVVSDRMRKLATSFKKGAPQAKVFYLATTPVTGRRPAPKQAVTSLGGLNDVVLRLNSLSAQVMKEEKIELIDAYSLLVDKLELATGDTMHWEGPAYKLISEEMARKIFSHLKIKN